jgi:hypothetical protein
MNTVNGNDALRYSVGRIQSNCLALTYDTEFLNNTAVILNTRDFLELVYHLVSSASEGKSASFLPQHIAFRYSSSSSFQGTGLSTCSGFISIFMSHIWVPSCYRLTDGNVHVPIFHPTTDVFSPAICNFI